MGVVDAIGVIGSALTIIGFLQSNIPDNPPKGAKIRIKAGLSGDDDPQADGQIARAFAWDKANNYLGQARGAHLEEGDTADLIIDQHSPSTRAELVSIVAAKDAVCIAWVTVSMNDDTRGGAWTGDIGYHCGQSWYEQIETAGYLSENSTIDYVPKCTWLDEDHSYGIKSAAMKFNTSAYGKKVVETMENAKACDYTLWKRDSGPISDVPGKRALRPRKRWMEDKLVVSKMSQHKAINLCSSDTSWGPDFVGSDGMFCDMSTKTLMPLCSTNDVEGCVEVDDQVKTVKKRSIVAGRPAKTTHRTYKKFDNWG